MRFSFLIMTLALTCLAEAQAAAPITLMPLPASFQPGSGELTVNQSFSIALTGAKDERLERAAHNFGVALSRRTAIPLDRSLHDPAGATLIVRIDHAAKEVQELNEDESYRMDVRTSGAELSAATTLGAMHGLQSFLQLVHTSGAGFAVPAVSIQDTPRFRWRGLMIDVSRHFFPLDVLKRNLDGMAALKMNVFHWHLSDNQGFRVESKKFPKLHELGSDGFYYTQDQVRELIAYAHDRGIRVVPEFDMPGHSTAWFVGYPDLASAPGPYEIERKWGVFDPAMNPIAEETYKFLDEFIGEMAELFPDRFFHIGGDEVNGKQWDANSKIQEFKRLHGMKTNQELRAYFNQHVQKIVSKHKRTMVGWDEILNPDLPKDIVIQSWRGQESLAGAATQGYRGLLSYGYYLDLMWPAWQHYAIDPLADPAAALRPEEKERILGGEACMWSEYVSPENIDSRIWPRMAVIAERLWSPELVQDIGSMYARMGIISSQLDYLGLTHHSYYPIMLRRIAGTNEIDGVRLLADVVEPVKDYTREETAPDVPTSRTPLNRMIDAARPESDVGRQFANLVDDFVSGHSSDPDVRIRIRSLLTKWRENHSRLQALISNSFLLKEVAPVSQDLSAVAAAGLAAMDFLDSGQSPPDSWKDSQLAFLENANKAKAQLLLVVVPSVEKLVGAATRGRPSATSR